MILNTTELGKWCIDLDPYKDHEAETMKEWFDEHNREKGNQNLFIRYAEHEDMSEDDPREIKVRVTCMQNCDCTRIRFPPK